MTRARLDRTSGGSFAAPSRTAFLTVRAAARPRADGWALFGLGPALDAQGPRAEAADVHKAFDQAWAFADVKLASSRF